jgi:formate dehydrogenase gamma subunit
MRGVSAAPVCTDCHGYHRVLDVPDNDREARQDRSARHSCPACHSSPSLMGEFGVLATRVSTYAESYHGLVYSRGGTAVADCASCHGVHDILPSSHEDSRIAPWHLQETCGECHENANEEFAAASVHYDETTMDSLEVTITRWVRNIYWVLLFAVLGGMVLHNLVILSWYARRRWRDEKREDQRFRFGRRQMFQHGLLIVTFFLLVVTGFMLAYPGTWWSRLLVDMGVNEQIRRWSHRVSAILMIVSSIYHAWWVLFAPRGKAELRRIAPGMADLRHVIQNMRYHMGQSDERPAFGKYDYPAKAEYWALVWGTLIMALTGFVLWWPDIATQYFPAWIVKVSEVVHLFEAWLAMLAIVIFHFFYVIAHPDVYPLSFAMFTGKMGRKHAEHHHPGWSEDEDPAPR